ncbi:MAG: AzlD domain-containing protein [Desulforegulaceae bacterium]|jgi:branched-subunit amino acid transport protein|nr:AzlD domain-containing protein [Desulforegulaceae bacterium]
MSDENYILLVLGMGIVSFIPRWIPLFYLSRKELPELVIEWLELIPVAILSALLFPALFVNPQTKDFCLISAETIAFIPCFIIAWFTRSLGITLVCGMFFYWAGTKFLNFL